MTLSTTQLRKLWKNVECRPEKMKVIDFGPDQIRVAPQTIDAWHALHQVLEAHKYRLRTPDTDSYNCRKITGGRGKSLHSFGIALDINWQTNPYIKTPDRRKVRFSKKDDQSDRATDVKQALVDTDMTSRMIEDILAIRTHSGKRVFKWGGHFKTCKDAMHFEIDQPPEVMMDGIDPETVKKPEPENAAPVSANDTPAEGATMTAKVTPAFLTAHQWIAKWEGTAFTNDPDDPGGATKYGITQATLAHWRGEKVTTNHVRNLTEAEAEQIFYNRYWRPLHCDQLPLPVALMTYNAGVNTGPSRGAKFLQKSLNALGSGLVVDGEIGQLTLRACGVVAPAQVVDHYSDIMDAHYKGLRHFAKFGNGWLNRLKDITKAALKMPVQAAPISVPPTTIPPPATSVSMTPTTTASPQSWEKIGEELARLLRGVNNGRVSPPVISAAPSVPAVTGEMTANSLGDLVSTLQQLIVRLDGSAKATETPVALPPPTPTTPPTPPNPKLTPVNAALGDMIGNLLNGRKTAIGIIGMLATTFATKYLGAPAGNLIETVSEVIQNPASAAEALKPVFGAMAGWGVLGKIDKWVNQVKNKF